MRTRRSSNDLFEIFPDLPGLRKRTPQEQVDKVHRQVAETRDRAQRNIVVQRRNAAIMQARFADRRQR